MTVDIQEVIDSITSDEYPEWTILLGIGVYDVNSLLTEADFTDPVIDKKINTIPTATLTFLNMDEDDLQDVAIRIYKDGKKEFSGNIKKCTTPYRSHQVQVECLGIVSKIQENSIKEVNDLTNIKSSDIINDYLTPPGWTIVIDTSENDFEMNYRLETGNFLQHINNICVLNYWEWWDEEEDSDTTIATRKLMIAPRRGSDTPVTTFQLEDSAYDAIIEKDKDKLKNAILVSGSSSQASNTGTTATGFFPMGDSATPTEMGYVIGSESILAEPGAIGDTSIVLESVTGYLNGTYTVELDGDDIVYTAADEATNTLTLDTALTTAYEIGTPVLNKSLLRAYIPSSMMSTNSVWIGNEKIGFIFADYFGIHTLTRGKDSSPAYSHGDGTKIFSGAYSFESPATTSSVGKWGQGDERINNYGSTDRDGLDKMGVSVLLASQTYDQYGSFNAALDQINGLDLGDIFYLQDYDTGESITRRCMGLKFAGDIVTISFGLNDTYILNQFDAVNKIDNSSYIKQDLDDSKEILAVSDDGTAVKILTKSGDQKWITIR